jgi:hypothetical protein
MRYIGSHYSLIPEDAALSPQILEQAALFLEGVITNPS